MQIVANLLSQLDQRKSALIHDLSPWTHEQLSWKPNEAAWNALQTLEHIIALESICIGYIKQRTSGGWQVLSQASEAHHEASAMMHFRMLSSDKYTLPEVLPVPTGSQTLPELLAMWQASRKEINDVLSSLSPEFQDRLVFNHPLSGPMTPAHALEFLNYHLGHHIPQFQRLRENQGF